MPGTIVHAMPRTRVYFNAATSDVETIITKGIEALAGREGTLLVRLHLKSFATSASYIKIVVRSEAPAPDDPGQDFVFKPGTELATVTVDTTSSTPPFPGILVVPIKSAAGDLNLGSHLRLVSIIKGGLVTEYADLSADIVLKSA